MSRPRQRMNPPHKVGARIWVPGFHINGHGSPFHQLLKLPQFNTSVHRKVWREQGLPLVYDNFPREKVLTKTVTKVFAGTQADDRGGGRGEGCKCARGRAREETAYRQVNR